MLSTRGVCGPWRTLKVVRGWLRVLWHTKFLSYYSWNILYFRMGLHCIYVYTRAARERERKTTKAVWVKNTTTTTVTTATTTTPAMGIERVESLRGKLCARENRINNNY